MKYECTEDILGRAMVLTEIIDAHLSDIEQHLKESGVSAEQIRLLQTISGDVSHKYDQYLFMVEDIIQDP